MQKQNAFLLFNFFSFYNYKFYFFKSLNHSFSQSILPDFIDDNLFVNQNKSLKPIRYLKQIKKNKISFFKLVLNIKKRLNTCKFNHILVINLLQNNIFAFLLTLPAKKVIFFKTASSYNIKITKKLLKRNCFSFLKPIILLLYKHVTDRHIIIIISSRKKLRKKILKYLNIRLQVFTKLLCVNSLYCFNGCRAKKIKRKKRKGLRIFK